jgi:hypothetical protein
MRTWRAIVAGAVLLAGAAAAAPAAAWNGPGHMMVAAIAWEQLTPAAKKRVAELLALNQFPHEAIKNLTGVDPAKAAFMMAATGPDAIKTDGSFIPDNQDPITGPDAARNTGFDDKLRHRYWHFIDIPFSTDGTPVMQAPPLNARERIALFRQTIASDTAADALKAYDLVWLIHLIGDVHQPLHATSRFTQDGDPKTGDRGANLVILCADPQHCTCTQPRQCKCKDKNECSGELHGVWDGLLGTNTSATAIIAAGAKLPPADAQEAASLDVDKWIAESFQDAKDVAYQPPIESRLGPFILTAAYQAKASSIAMQRAALAGARLANVINRELK